MVRVITEGDLALIVARTGATIARDEWPKRKVYRMGDGKGLIVTPGPKSGTVRVSIVASCDC